MSFFSRKVFLTGGSGFIGTNLVQSLVEQGAVVYNFDRDPPRNSEHYAYWIKGELGRLEDLAPAVEKVEPEYIIHLGARTDLDGDQIEDYYDNISGAQNIIKAVNEIGGVRRIIFVSSMLVSGPGKTPANLDDCNPTTAYGSSKLEMEKIIRAEKINSEWLIVRPTSIWGPWFAEPYRNFFEMVLKGRYFHAGNRSSTKTFGFVGNSVRQIETLLTEPFDLVQGKMFYIGDSPPLNNSLWADQVRLACAYKTNIRLPYCFMRLLSLFGDVLKVIGVRFPMTSFRLKNMTNDNIIDLQHLERVVGKPHFDTNEGIRQTLEWLVSRND